MAVTHDTDTSTNRRTVDPHLYGFIPDGPQGNIVCIFIFLVGGSYFASRLVGIGVLGGASILGLGVYLGVEPVLLLLMTKPLKPGVRSTPCTRDRLSIRS